MDDQDLKRRARGALLGAAIGDAMGAPCEGMSASAIRERYGIVTDFVTSTSIGTDDTDFTLFNAHILLTHGAGVTPDQVEVEWRTKLLSGAYPYRPGGFSDVIATRNLHAGLHAPASGAFNHQMWSDGVAMAVSPAGICSPGHPDAAARIAAALGSVSNARDGIYAAQAVAAAISMAMVGARPDAMFAAALRVIPQDSWTYRMLARTQAILERNLGMSDSVEALANDIVVSYYPWADIAPEAVSLAFAAFVLTRGAVAEAIPVSLRFGRDADTIGAITGSLAGAYCGADAIPNRWLSRVSVSSGACIGFVANWDIAQVADQLVDVVVRREFP